MLALKGSDGTVLSQPYHLVQSQLCLPHTTQGKQAEQCQAYQEAYIDSILHIVYHLLLLTYLFIIEIALRLELLEAAVSCYTTLLQYNDAVAMLYGA